MPVRTTPATHRLCAALLAALAAPALPAMAQEAGSKDAKPTVKTLDQVTVTGSRIKRAEIEQALPITSFTKAEIDAAGITSADHVAINETGKRQQDGSQIAAGTLLFVVQGQDPSDPAARRSMTDVAQAVDRPVEQSLQKVDTLAQQQTQMLAQAQNNPTQDDLGPKGPRMS